MATAVRTEPISLNESTLETNIVGEIAALFNNPFNFGYPARLRWLFDFSRINLNAFNRRKTKIYRLTPNEENKGGGWDSKVVIPTGKNGSRAIFIQFKRGKHSEGNDLADSIFNLKKKTPNKHAEFDFNDNSNNNQHATLKSLSDQLHANGVSPNSVMYAFPRITSLDAFDKLQEDLLLHTSFLTLPEIDDEASNAGVDLYDNSTHHFRTCYLHEKRREISSKPFQLRQENINEGVITEIILTKLTFLRDQFLKQRSPLNIVDTDLLLMLADYLKINPLESISQDELLPYGTYNEFRDYFVQLKKQRNNNFSGIFQDFNDNSNTFNWRDRVFKRVATFLAGSQRDSIDMQSQVPTQFSFNVSALPEQMRLELDGPVTMLTF